jgi:hypothetical protein
MAADAALEPPRRPLWPLAFRLALVVSLALHLLALFGPPAAWFHLNPEPAPVLLATLNPGARKAAPAPPAKPKAAPKPKVHHKTAGRVRPKPLAPVVVDATPETAPNTAAATSNPADDASAKAVEKTAEKPAVDVPPLRGFTRFKVCKGTQGFEIGRSEHKFDIGRGRYQIRTVTETTGLAALVVSAKLVQESSGSLDANGLVPERFRTWLNGQPGSDQADFDWAAGKLRLGKEVDSGEGGQTLLPGSQDLASFIFQLGYLGGQSSGKELSVTTGKHYERNRLNAVGEEMLETPLGTLETLHLRAKSRNTYDIWLAVDRQWLPVKVRFTDDKGEIFEQILTDLHLDTEK